MRILWICGSRIVGGAERVTIQVLRLLRLRGHSVNLLCPARSELPQALDGCGFELAFAPLGGSLNIRACFSIARALKRAAPSVALVTTSDEWVWATLAPNPRNIPLVLVRHMALKLPWPVRMLADWRADAVVAVSEAVRGSLFGLAGVRHDLVHVVHNPVRFFPRSQVPSREERARARAILGLPVSGRMVGFFGGLDERKGIGDVISAVSQANREIAGETHLLICGRQARRSLKKTFDDWVRGSNSPDNLFHYLGQTERMCEAITAADVVVMATRSDLKEGLPLTAMEAMACGTPVLAYATGGVAEAVGDDETSGRLARPDDVEDLTRKLIDMLSSEDGANTLCLNALERVRQMFAPETAADRYERLFRALSE